jgi:hypothetical protein
LVRAFAVRGFVIPANTGESAKAVRAAFGERFDYIVVANQQDSHAKGYVHHCGISEATLHELQGLGMEVVLHEHSCFWQKSPASAFWEHNRAFEESPRKSLKAGSIEIDGTSLSAIIERTTICLFDQGFKTAVEMALLAGAAEKADRAAKHVSFAFPYPWSDMRDVAIVSQLGTPASFFPNGLDIRAVAFSSIPGKA